MCTQAEERVRKISSDLRCDSVDLGGAGNIIEQRTKKKKKKKMIKNKTTVSKDIMNDPLVRTKHL